MTIGERTALIGVLSSLITDLSISAELRSTAESKLSYLIEGI